MPSMPATTFFSAPGIDLCSSIKERRTGTRERLSYSLAPTSGHLLCVWVTREFQHAPDAERWTHGQEGVDEPGIDGRLQRRDQANRQEREQEPDARLQGQRSADVARVGKLADRRA